MLAPFSIYPFDAETVADLILGYLTFFTHLNLTRLEPLFEREGMTVRFGPDEQVPDLFFEAEKQVSATRAIAIQTRAPVREQMLIELMTPASLIAGIRHLLDEQDKVGAANSVALDNEAATWERVAA